MASRTVNGHIDLPGGNTPSSATVRIELVASDKGEAPGYTSTKTILGVYEPTVTDGVWSADLDVNADLTPSNTYYRITTKVPGFQPVVETIEVPAGASALNVPDVLVATPTALPANPTISHADLTGRSANGHDQYFGYPEKLRRWWYDVNSHVEAVKRGATGKAVKIVTIGDSITVGLFDQFADPQQLVAGWAERIGYHLAQKYNYASNSDTHPGRWVPVSRSPGAVAPYKRQWDSWGGGTWSASTTPGLYGFGDNGGTLTNGQGGTHTEECDAITVGYMVRDTTTGSPDMLVRVDGSLVSTVTTTDGGLAVGSLAAGTLEVPLPVAGLFARKLEVEADGAGTLTVSGAYFHRAGNQDSGFSSWNAGHSGYAWEGDEAGGTAGWEHTFLTIEKLDPSLIVVFLGVNNRTQSDADYRTAAEEFAAELAASVANIATDGSEPSVLLVHPMETQGAVTWSSKAEIVRDIADTYDWAFLDANELVGSVADDEDVFDESSDGVHLAARGHETLASYIGRVIWPPESTMPAELAGEQVIANRLPTMARGIAPDGPFFHTVHPAHSARGTWAGLENTVYLIPATVLKRLTLQTAGIEVVSAAANSNFRLGLYTADGVRLVADFGTIDCSSTGLRTVNHTDVTVPPGSYFCAMVPQGSAAGTTTIRSATFSLESPPLLITSAPGATPAAALGVSSGTVTGALPGSLTADYTTTYDEVGLFTVLSVRDRQGGW